jgi:DNA-binding Lrp family transcriptional regulator
MRSYGEASIREFARRLGASEDTVKNQIQAAKEERSLNEIGSSEPNQIEISTAHQTEDYKHYLNTMCLRDDPETRVELPVRDGSIMASLCAAIAKIMRRRHFAARQVQYYLHIRILAVIGFTCSFY